MNAATQNGSARAAAAATEAKASHDSVWIWNSRKSLTSAACARAMKTIWVLFNRIPHSAFARMAGCLHLPMALGATTWERSRPEPPSSVSLRAFAVPLEGNRTSPFSIALSWRRIQESLMLAMPRA